MREDSLCNAALGRILLDLHDIDFEKMTGVELKEEDIEMIF